ncbi:hypothetical protein AGABI2DRAFT_194199 [Agaricus bisporus var. bisporus H97]|uniref:hypothetical protein n=1 Tax=Agaricus bisporus var. bisporus (strain H97 / ATCC MYA-4626 / FGSC 10389) TaxID=936046 RepID=UPI00029F6BF3|nr:hypothetical protein AGABI2DRAFT_194199 [Agaricus bisporus var. bisporus H97]EKV45215.1 hypothetical protein AGABI2DRAFT_194199 [Agaricus bisporus var. bisporus H97]
MFASRIVRQMASGANKDPAKVKKENQRVMIGIAGLMGLTGLAYYAGYFSESGRPNRSLERKQNLPRLNPANDDAVIEEVATIE